MTDYNINAGKYRHRITIRNPADDSSRDAAGGRLGQGTDVCTVWAEKQDWTGSESVEGKRETAVVVTKWKIRWRSDVLPKMFVVDGSDLYDIEAVQDYDGRKRELTLIARKVVSPG